MGPAPKIPRYGFMTRPNIIYRTQTKQIVIKQTTRASQVTVEHTANIYVKTCPGNKVFMHATI